MAQFTNENTAVNLGHFKFEMLLGRAHKLNDLVFFSPISGRVDLGGDAGHRIEPRQVKFEVRYLGHFAMFVWR